MLARMFKSKKTAATRLAPDSRGQNTARAQGGMRGIARGGGHPFIRVRIARAHQYFVDPWGVPQRAQPVVIQRAQANPRAGEIHITTVHGVARQRDPKRLLELPNKGTALVQIQHRDADHTAQCTLKRGSCIHYKTQVVRLTTHVQLPLVRLVRAQAGSGRGLFYADQ